MAPPIGQMCPRKGVWVYKVIGYLHTNIIVCHTKLITVPKSTNKCEFDIMKSTFIATAELHPSSSSLLCTEHLVISV